MDQGFRIAVSEAVEPHATVCISGSGVDLAEIEATIYGPKCAYARTLPTTFTPSRRGTGRIEFLIQDPCYWTPALPFLYELALERTDLMDVTGPTTGAGQERQVLGLRRLVSRRSSLYLDGKRFVPRGVRCESLTLEAMEQARRAEVALVVPAPPSPALREANLRGVPIVADLRSGRPDQAAWLGNDATLFPSVLMTIIDARQFEGFEHSGLGEDSLLAIAVGRNNSLSNAALQARRSLIAVELQAGERPPAWIADCGRPVIAIRRSETYADFYAARAACDELQAEFAPEFDLAGYFV